MELNQKQVKDRKEMFSFFDSVLSNEQYLETDEEVGKKLYIKTQIIESNADLAMLNELKVDDYSFQLKPTDDKFLFNLIINSHRSTKPTIMYLDSIHKRYWKIYSLEKSIESAAFFKTLTRNSINLDSLWMPHQMLQEIGKKENAISKGFSIKFSQRVALSDDEFSINDSDSKDFIHDFENFTIRLWTRKNKPSEKLMKLLENENMPTTTTSTRLQIGSRENYVKDEIYYDGRFTIQKGNDFKEHNILVDDVIQNYQDKMEIIEAQRIQMELKAEAFKMKGHPFELKFSNKIPIKKFVDKVFSSTNPFRVWGSEYDEQSDFLRIAAVDCHTGDMFNMDLMDKYARVYLRNKACGNLIFRLYTNIQHYFDPKVTIRGENGQIFN